jgi:DMSO/TMAO reductase YedYZ molybdopterin-dependent catalytic subunit
MADDEKLRRVLEARAALRRRFEAEMRGTPSIADPKPQGSGPANRHGMPTIPVGQTETRKWPVLDLGNHPDVALTRWTLAIDGAVATPQTLRWEDFLALEQVEDTSDFHCVTTWSRLNLRWQGVRVADVLALAEPDAAATHLMCHAYDGYSTNLALAEALKPDVLLVHTVDGAPLPREHGGPVRMITPQLYAWKGAKWISRLEVLTADRPGFWEERGYSMTAHPWRNDRYR